MDWYWWLLICVIAIIAIEFFLFAPDKLPWKRKKETKHRWWEE